MTLPVMQLSASVPRLPDAGRDLNVEAVAHAPAVGTSPSGNGTTAIPSVSTNKEIVTSEIAPPGSDETSNKGDDSHDAGALPEFPPEVYGSDDDSNKGADLPGVAAPSDPAVSSPNSFKDGLSDTEPNSDADSDLDKKLPARKVLGGPPAKRKRHRLRTKQSVSEPMEPAAKRQHNPFEDDDEDEDEIEVEVDPILGHSPDTWRRAGISDDRLNNLKQHLASNYGRGLSFMLVGPETNSDVTPPLEVVVQRMNRLPMVPAGVGLMERLSQQPFWEEHNLNQPRVVKSDEACQLDMKAKSVDESTTPHVMKEREESKTLARSKNGGHDNIEVECPHHTKDTFTNISKCLLCTPAMYSQPCSSPQHPNLAFSPN